MKRKFLSILLIIFLCGCSLDQLSNQDLSPTIKRSLLTSKTEKLSSQNLVWQVEPGESFSEEYFVFQKTEPAQIKGVFSADIFLLTEDDYSIYKEKTKNGECPASFFNSNAVIMSVMSEKTSVINSLKKLKEGDNIFLIGNDLNYTVETPDGDPIDFAMDSKVRPVYLQSISIK